MKIWIHIDGEQKGPYDLDSLPLDCINSDTPVWHAGLADWVAAKDSPVVSLLLAHGPKMSETEWRPSMQTPTVAGKVSSHQARVHRPADRSATAMPADAAHTGPATTYLLPTLIISLLTYNLVGIVPFILGLVVKWRNSRHAYASAWSLSQCTAWWVMITIVISLMLPFSILI